MSRIYPCVYCTDDLHCTKYTDDNYEAWCVLGPCQDETPSNADRIRAMTDEELATWITDEVIEPGYFDDEHTYELWLDWLRKEVTDDNNS